MEQSQLETLDLSDPLFPLHPLRRRPLESETYCTLVRLLSHCYGNSQLSHQTEYAAIEDPKQGDNELEISTQPAVCNEERGTQSPEVVATTTGCVGEDRMELDGSEKLHSLTKECSKENDVGHGSLDESRDLETSLTIQNDQCAIRDVSMEESGNVGCVAEAKGLSIFEDGEDIDFLFDDLCLEKDSAEGSLSFARNETKEATQEMHPMELETSVTLAAAMGSPINADVDEDLEEGEIMGSFGVDSQSIDVFLEDTASLVNKKVERGLDNEATLGDANREVRSTENCCKAVDEVKKLNVSESILSVMESKYGNFGEAKIAHKNVSVPNVGEKRKQTAPLQLWETKENYAVKSEGNSSAEKDRSLKKKRGPPTEERKEKQKRKKKIKRAEKNKQQGVKRLKIEPIVKPKKVTHCRHYLKGRCQEGEKCKFSHDVVPLTKSQPCCHFARKSCMKGDDCPYDHQLSKYPCNNYVSKGFCGRGADCMFSHEMSPPLDGSSQKVANVSEPQPNSSSLSMPSGKKNTEKNVTEAIIKPPLEKPKGIGKLLFGESSFGGSLSNINQAGSSSRKLTGSGKVDPPIGHRKLDTTQNLKEALKGAAGVVGAKGLNFLSFGSPTGGDPSSSNKPPSLSFSGAKTTVLDKKTALSGKKHDGPGTANQMAQNARDVMINQDETSKKQIPGVLPRGINFLSFGRTPIQEPSGVKLAQVPSSNGNSGVVSSPKDRGIGTQLQNPSANPLKLHSSPPSESLKALFSGTPNTAQKAFASSTPTTASKANISNMPTSTQKSLLSTLAFAAKYESKIKMDQPAGLNQGSSSGSQSTSRGSTILDFLYGGGSKNKQ